MVDSPYGVILLAQDRRTKRRQQREGKASQRRLTQKTEGGLLSRLSSDWIVGGLIGGVVIIAALVFFLGQWVRGDSTPTLAFQQVLSLAVSPANPDTLFIGDQVGLFRSVDRGQEWEPVSGLASDVQALLADPSDPSGLIASAAGFIYRSSDGG